jgi:hypothetical protein
LIEIGMLGIKKIFKMSIQCIFPLLLLYQRRHWASTSQFEIIKNILCYHYLRFKNKTPFTCMNLSASVGFTNLDPHHGFAIDPHHGFAIDPLVALRHPSTPWLPSPPILKFLDPPLYTYS